MEIRMDKEMMIMLEIIIVNSNSNGENIKEIFGKDVDEGIEKVNIKKSKLK